MAWCKVDTLGLLVVTLYVCSIMTFNVEDAYDGYGDGVKAT